MLYELNVVHIVSSVALPSTNLIIDIAEKGFERAQKTVQKTVHSGTSNQNTFYEINLSIFSWITNWITHQWYIIKCGRRRSVCMSIYPAFYI